MKLFKTVVSFRGIIGTSEVDHRASWVQVYHWQYYCSSKKIKLEWLPVSAQAYQHLYIANLYCLYHRIAERPDLQVCKTRLRPDLETLDHQTCKSGKTRLIFYDLGTREVWRNLEKSENYYKSYTLRNFSQSRACLSSLVKLPDLNQVW